MLTPPAPSPWQGGPAAGHVALDVAGATRPGHERRSNQDHFCIAELRKELVLQATSASLVISPLPAATTVGHLLIVADGVGGGAAGEVASELAVGTALTAMHEATPWFLSGDDGLEESMYDRLSRVIEAAHAAVTDEAMRKAEYAGMATTLTLALVLWPRLYVGHVGDSRCYVRHAGELRQVTGDHTIAARMIAEGVLDGTEARRSPLQHVLWNAVGGRNGVDPQVYTAWLRSGDGILLCTDGLTDCVAESSIAAVLEGSGSAFRKCQKLIAAAREAGAADDVTAVVAEFGEAK
jgi:protein phosphatase